MIKIAISGKANSGKNTATKLLTKLFLEKNLTTSSIAFADPIKKMIKIMFPNIPRKFLYGSSKYRSSIIPNISYENAPVTIRDLLILIGTKLGRNLNDSVWLDNFDIRLSKIKTPVVIVSDCRFRNEFDHLKNSGFFLIRIKRAEEANLSDISEFKQSEILDEEFNVVIDNNEGKKELKEKLKNLKIS